MRARSIRAILWEIVSSATRGRSSCFCLAGMYDGPGASLVGFALPFLIIELLLILTPFVSDALRVPDSFLEGRVACAGRFFNEEIDIAGFLFRIAFSARWARLCLSALGALPPRGMACGAAETRERESPNS